jgi:hypothetical protein
VSGQHVDRKVFFVDFHFLFYFFCLDHLNRRSNIGVDLFLVGSGMAVCFLGDFIDMVLLIKRLFSLQAVNFVNAFHYFFVTVELLL